MVEEAREFTRAAVVVLELLAVASGLALVGFAAVSLFVATVRVAVLGRVFVLPFGGNDERRVELTELFIQRLTAMEREWITRMRSTRSVPR